ncbi:hypothetical protein [Acinetobacter guerrae]|uniref:hypothetical protein n=1 Tax=Acinetobacter guerrae TaxID=1843371 RepID=UPI00128B98D0|nr:hypothetical protein [Acinetobacter guerrae]MPW44795.1 hypothetical protein [Acinetobacter guerrae]
MKRIILSAVLVLGLVGCNKETEISKNENKSNSELNKYAEQQRQEAAKQVTINPKKDIVEVARCTAASMRMGQGIGIYKVWTEELKSRYGKIYPQKGDAELEAYTGERITDKLEDLRNMGLDSTQSFYDYYKTNCLN